MVVATVRALKMHGGGPPVSAGRPLQAVYKNEAVDLVEAGVANLQHHVRNAVKFGVKVVVAVNRFATDTDTEIEAVRAAALEAGASAAVEATHWSHGGAGAADLGRAVAAACEEARDAEMEHAYLYESAAPLKEKVRTVCEEVYGAAAVEYSELASAQLEAYEKAGYGHLPICIAKTQYSLSCDPALKGVPTGFTVTVREARASVGAGFIYLLVGDIMTVPGLPTRPGFYDVDVDIEKGRVVGLF